MSKKVKRKHAKRALEDLMWELPYEFKFDPSETRFRESFHVIKGKNVGHVHKALWTLQQYFKEEDKS